MHAGRPTPSVREERMAGFIITRIQTGDYERWRPLFDGPNVLVDADE
jgi:hypothetical protein